MSNNDSIKTLGTFRTRFLLLIVIFMAVLLFTLTYLGIQKSRSDALELINQQGIALIESLTLSADNAIKANSFFDLLVQEKFSDLVGFLETRENLKLGSPELADFATGYGVDVILIFDDKKNIIASGSRGVFFDVNRVYAMVIPEMENLLGNQTNVSSFQVIDGEYPGEKSIMYLQKTASGKNIIAIVADAIFYSQVKEDIGIGYLVRNISREVGIEYILFQTTDGIVFSSRKVGPVLKIEKDDFLQRAIGVDSVMSRKQVFNETRVLELVKRFYSEVYGDGLFRIGLSLEKYHSIMAGFDRQMIALSAVIFAVLVLLILYLNSKQKRLYLDRSYHRVKSLSEKVFDSINSGIVVINQDSTIEMANHQFGEIFELNSDDLIGNRWYDYSFGRLIPVKEILSGESRAGEAESTISVPAGKKYLLINTGQLYDQKNKVAGIVAVVYDYTEIKELEESARRKERLTEMGDLAAGVAHEIRNPLNAISIAAQRLLAEFEPKENIDEFQSFIKQIRSEANRLNEIVTRFLSMARDGGARKTEINLSKIVMEAIELIKIGNERKDIVIKTELDADIITSLSEDRIKQMVINLVNNAIQAMNKTGGEISIGLHKDKKRIALTVSDTGPGIPDEIKSKIFSPYFTTRKEGTGLGLSIVHQIVEESKGTIEVESSNGVTRFIVSFPV
ncbi:MAG: ATP-binding protein [Candidatus Zixiibacteriota bacterium]